MSSLFDGGKVLANALTAQRQRFETVLTNIANAQTTRTPEGGPYRKRQVVFEAVPLESSFGSVFRQELSRPLSTVRVAGVVDTDGPLSSRFDPSHPDADSRGYVTLPDVDPTAEMMDLMAATRSFQALVAGLGAIKDLVSRSLELGK